MIARFQNTGVSAGMVNCSYLFRIPYDPGQPDQQDDREEDTREPDGEVVVAAR